MLEVNPKQISFARLRRRLTKSQLAKKLEITSRSLQNYETGASTPDDKTLQKIAIALNYPLQFFIWKRKCQKLQSIQLCFRKLSKMTEAMKGCAFAAGAIALKVNNGLKSVSTYQLPTFQT